MNSAERLTYRFSVQAPNFRSVCVNTIVLSLHQRKHVMVSLCKCRWLVCSGDCIHCKTNNQPLESFSEKVGKIVIFGCFFRKFRKLRKIPASEKYPLYSIHVPDVGFYCDLFCRPVISLQMKIHVLTYVVFVFICIVMQDIENGSRKKEKSPDIYW